MIVEIAIAGITLFTALKWREKYQIYKKERKEIDHVLEFVEEVINTKDQDWELDEIYRTYELKRTVSGRHSDCDIIFTFYRHFDTKEYIGLFINIGGKIALQVRLDMDSNELWVDYKSNQDKHLRNEEKQAIKKSMKHLRLIQIEKRKKLEMRKRQEKNEKKKEFEKKQKEIIENMQQLLEDDDRSSKNKTHKNIELEIGNQNSVNSLRVIVEGRTGVEIFYLKEQDEFEVKYYEFHDFINEIAEFEEKLKKYIKQNAENKTLKQNTEGTAEWVLDRVLEENKKLDDWIAKIKTEEDWLTMEFKHMLDVTIPSDKEKMINVYIKVKNKKDIEADVLESFQAIKKKLQRLEEEIEKEKIRNIKFRKEVIKSR